MALALSRCRAITVSALHLTGQLLVITAIPLALWKLSGNPIPAHLATWEQIQQQWRGIEQQPSQITQFALRAAADLLWIIWAWHTLWTAIAYLWVLLHLPCTVLPGALAAITPAVALRALSLGALISSPTLPVYATTAATAATAPATPAPVPSASAVVGAQAANTGATVHVVEPGDNLWDLADHYYHQGEDWHQIYRANRGVIQPDGHDSQSPSLILPGWHLTIPGDVAPGSAAPRPGAARPAVAPPHGPTAARPAPTGAPGRPAPAPARSGAPRPAAERPHTVGYALPDDAGYVGITLIAAVAAAVAILRTRNRRRSHPSNQGIPDLAQHLAAVHSLARSANTYGFRPEDHPGHDVPPLYQPTEGQVSIATSPDSREENLFDPDALPGPLVLTGPGAQDAARALAINTLATTTHTLRTDPDLSTELLGTPAPHAQPEGPGVPAAETTTIRAARPDTDYNPGTVVLGTPDHTEDATHLEVERDGTVRSTSGPAAGQYSGTRLHSLAPHAAAALHHTLDDAKPTPAGSPAGQDNASTAGEPVTKAEHGHIYAFADPNQTARDLATTPLILCVLGEPDILTDTTNSPIDTEQAAALLTILALHPDGISTRELRALEWPDATDDRRARLTMFNAINRVRSRLRTGLAPELEVREPILYNKARRSYRLNPHIVVTDLALAQRLTQQAADANNTEELLRLLSRAAPLYRGELALGLDDNHRHWLTTARYTLLNDAVALRLRIADLATGTEPELAAAHLKAVTCAAPEDPQVVASALRICARLGDTILAEHIYRNHLNALRQLGEEPDPIITAHMQGAHDKEARHD